MKIIIIIIIMKTIITVGVDQLFSDCLSVNTSAPKDVCRYFSGKKSVLISNKFKECG